MIDKQLSLKDPLTKIILITLVIVVGVYISCQKFVLKTHKQKLAKLNQKLEHIKLEDEIGRLYKEVNSCEKALPPQKDSSWLRIKITELAQEAELDVSSLEPLSTKQLPPYTYIPFKIVTVCTYKQLLEFIDLIESNPYLIAIESLKVVSSEKYKGEIPKEEAFKDTSASVEIVIGTVY